MPPDETASEAAPFPVTCPKCGTAVLTTVADQRSSIRCPACQTEIDLTTEEVRHARQSAAAKATIEDHKEGEA
jgi:DNA-directed RNA polymerase subunit M/transcription elongation factor TFIIS